MGCLTNSGNIVRPTNHYPLPCDCFSIGSHGDAKFTLAPRSNPVLAARRRYIPARVPCGHHHCDGRQQYAVESVSVYRKPAHGVEARLVDHLNKEVGDQLLPGPRMVSYGKLYTVHRIYDDVNGAFMVAIQPPITPGYVSVTRTRPQWRLQFNGITF